MEIVGVGPMPVFTVVLVSLVGILMWVWVIGLSLSRPPLLLYFIFALVPTQFIFIPISDFFISPADMLVLAAGVGLVVRLLAGKRRAWTSLVQHRYLGLMVLSYVFGFLVLGFFSRTLIRVVLAIIPSVLACELLRTRPHLVWAAAALVVAGIIDAGYGVVYYASGVWLDPRRFSGMSGVNFSAMVIITAAVIGFAKLARTRQPFKLFGPGVLMGFGVATLSKAGVLAFLSVWLVVLRRVVRKANKRFLVFGAVLLAILALSQGPVRQVILARDTREMQADGVERNTFDVRWMILRTAWRGFLENPILGIGFSRFLKYSTTDPEINASTLGQGYYTHNTYVEILVEGGLLAFFPFIIHFVQYGRGLGLALQAIARQRDVVLAASLAALPVMLVPAAFANVLLHYSFWSVCGLGLACVNLLRAETREAV